MPIVSVIIPFYNRFEWLDAAVRSVLDQTLTDLEIIMVDDGSDESGCFEIIDDPRIRYVRQENNGPAAARNLGIELSNGRYVAFLDSDDLFLPNKLEIQINYMENHPNIGLSHTSYLRINAEGEYIERMDSGKFAGEVYPGIISCCPIATPTVMIRRDVVDDLHFEELVRLGEDVILWIKIAKKYEINGIDEALTKVRIHGCNAIHNPEKQLIGNKLILKYAFENDVSLSRIFKLKSMSKMYAYIGYLYYADRNIKSCIWFFILSVLYWPLNSLDIFKLFIDHIGLKVRNIISEYIEK